jgi:hypothetical protein
MKTSKKILAVLLAVVMVIGVLSLSGCKAKQKEPQELFMNALQMYEDAIEKNEVVKLLTDACTAGSVSVNMKSYEDAVVGDINFDMTAYMDQAGNASSVVIKMTANESTYDAQLLLSDKKVVLASSLIKDAYGVDLESAVKNFPTSIFGTKGDNILDLTEEDEAEVLKVLQDAIDAMKDNANDIDLDKTMDDLFIKYAKFAADYDVESDVRGEKVKSNVVHATMTKTAVKSMVNELVDALEAKEVVDELLKSYNEMANVDGVLDEDAKVLHSLNDVVDEVFDKYQDGENVISIDMVLDTKYDAIMSMITSVGNNAVKVVVGKNPREIKQVDLAVTTDGETENLTLTIEDGSTSTKYKMVDDEQTGVVITIDEARKKVTLESLHEGKIDEEETYSFDYNLADGVLSLAFDVEDAEMTMTITIKANDKSPVKHTEFKDFLTMSADELEELIAELKPLIETFIPSEPEYDEDFDDEWDDEWVDTEYEEDLEVDWEDLQSA